MTRDKDTERIREMATTARETTKKIAVGLSEVAERIARVDSVRLTRNVITLSTGAMALYLMFSAVSTIAPQAMQVYAQFGTIIGYMIPMMFMITVLSIMMAVIKHVAM
jgi:hypothetical protein